MNISTDAIYVSDKLYCDLNKAYGKIATVSYAYSKNQKKNIIILELKNTTIKIFEQSPSLFVVGFAKNRVISCIWNASIGQVYSYLDKQLRKAGMIK